MHPASTVHPAMSCSRHAASLQEKSLAIGPSFDDALDLKTKSDVSVDGWISVVSEKIPAGDYWTLRWRVEGSCCHSWALRNLTTRYITP